jgi:hypothetical protein
MPVEPLSAYCGFRRMDLAKRQELQKAAQLATRRNSHVAVMTVDGRLALLQFDLTCYEMHIEGTDRNGAPITIPYSEIKSVSVSE